MASLTIDQLKKLLTEMGIALPPAGSKKAEYLRLYEQYSTLTDSLGDFYSSDDEIFERHGAQSVSSSSSPSKIENILKEVERLTDDELYNQLKEFGATIGPVLKNTRRVYEKKLAKLLGGRGSGGGQTNGLSSPESRKANSSVTLVDFSDSEIDIPPPKAVEKRQSFKESSKSWRSSMNRDSPKPSMEEPSVPEPSVERKYTSHSYSDFDNRSSSYGNYVSSADTQSRKFSFIEKIPRGTTDRYIEPSTEVPYSSKFRSRFSVDRPTLGQDDYYSGTWEPNVKKYLSSMPQQPQQQYQPSKFIKKRPSEASSSVFNKENIIAGIILMLFVLLVLYLVFAQWSASDPYKELEDDLNTRVEELEAAAAAK